MGLNLSGRRVLLTGASGGIGNAIARRVHSLGASLVITGRRADALESLRKELGDRVEVAPADLTEAAAVDELVDGARVIDVLIANAALPASGKFDSFTAEEIDRALDVNLRAPIQLARSLAPRMVDRRSGHIVFISSLSGKLASGGGSIYSATKFGMRGFAFAMREDLRGTGVGVTTVFPGFISDAGMWADTGLELPRGVGLRSPEQVAEAVVRGIERDRAEVDVAPLSLRAGAWISGAAPSVVAAVNRRLGSKQLAEGMADAQRPKR